MKKYLLAACMLSLSLSWAQETFPVNGMHEKPGTIHAFTNAHIVQNHKDVVENGTLIIQDDKIIGVGSVLNIPKGAIVHDVKGKYIYPSFIDLYSDYGMPEVKRAKWDPKPQATSNTEGAYAWNQALKPEYSAANHFISDDKKAKKLRAAGFGVVLSHHMDGIARGTGAVVSLADAVEQKSLISDRAAAFFSFKKGSSRQQYPSSLMGSIALLRQTGYDADWYKHQKNVTEKNLSLEAWNRNEDLPQIFEAGDYLSSLRADKIGDEFAKQFIFIGSGDEYKRAKDVFNLYGSFVLPLDFPKAYDVEDPWDADLVSLESMKHWEMAPYNPAILDKRKVEFTFTAKGNKHFLKHLRLAVEKGLSKETALKALTITPAKLLQMEDQLGSIAKGKMANFILCSGDLFDDKFEIYENWVQGKSHTVKDFDAINIAGDYDLQLDSIVALNIKGEGSAPKAKIVINDSTNIEVSLKVDGNLMSFNFYEKETGNWTFTGYKADSIWKGTGSNPAGEQVAWSLRKKEPAAAEAEKEETVETKEKKRKKDRAALPKVSYPSMAYGWTEAPKEAAVVFRNATVWTNEEEGILTETDVAISRGQIIAIGENLNPSEVFLKWKGSVDEVDATGMHITSGIIDEHSHIAISKGVNEGSQAVTAEVSIADVINSDDVNIYRQLAGGVTAAQLLHGSANPIGGQSGIIKLRWGNTPEDMKFKEAPGFIKFALGENVKQSNWGDFNTIRYPQTRMGVEQIYYDNFIRAKEYEQDWKKWGSLGLRKRHSANPPRRDLELQILVEILNQKRFVTCHSYIQSEINMLMHVADSMGFRMNTFTHI
ncbi:MAG: imidazolonepropionase-like amidohydrolase, partial [Flavobacteriales bacterium]